MMPTFPSSPLKFRTAGFAQYGFKVGFQSGPSLPNTDVSYSSSLPPPFVLAVTDMYPRAGSKMPELAHTAMRAALPALPQGSSLQFGFCCPDPSSLIRPHPSHWQAHRDFGAWRLIRYALAVRFRLGDLPLVPCFHCPSFVNMSSSTTTGSPMAASTQFLHHRRWPSSHSDRLGTSIHPANPFLAGQSFRSFTPVRLRYDLSTCSPP